MIFELAKIDTFTVVPKKLRSSLRLHTVNAASCLKCSKKSGYDNDCLGGDYGGTRYEAKMAAIITI